jgi:Family of unknown function (DUF6627)
MRPFMSETLLQRVAAILVLLMGVFSLVPRVEAGFIGSDQSLEANSRQQDLATLQRALENKLVQERLKALGYSDKEINSRLDQFSDQDLHNFATQIDTLTAGGDGLGLVIALLVIVILVIIILKLMDKKIVVS